MILQDGEPGAGGAPNGGRRPRVHMFAWPTLRMVICLVLNVGATVALTAIWLHHGNCTDGLIVVSTIFFGTFALREGRIILNNGRMSEKKLVQSLLARETKRATFAT